MSWVFHPIKHAEESTEKDYHAFKVNNCTNSQEKFTELSIFWNNWSSVYKFCYKNKRCTFKEMQI